MLRYLRWRLSRPAVWVWRRLQILCSKTYTASHTGNRSKRRGFLKAGGETRFCTLPLINGTIPYTHRDLSDLTIRCPWCLKPIFIGDYVTLYVWRKSIMVIPDGAHVYSIDPAIQVIGCQRDTCTDTIADCQGQWVPDDERPGHGRVERIMSAFEALAANPRATHAMVTTGKGHRTLKLFDILDD